jgi:divalent metal cation (Fe/Co/Zn/Cd) transporter
MAELAFSRHDLIRRGKKLEYFTIVWNSLEGLVAVLAGIFAGSISLVAFGIDSFIEVASGSALLWRIYSDADERNREEIERVALRIVAVCFFALALYVGYDATFDLLRRDAPKHSLFGIIVACVSLVVMPVLSRAKRRLAADMGSQAMDADAKQTEFCIYLSVILLVGLLLNAAFGLWWADPLGGLLMVPIILREGVQAFRARPCCP